MAHNITERDGMFTVRQPAWHKLGHVLSEYPTRAEAQAIAHPWEPVLEPIFSQEPGISFTGELETNYLEIPGYKRVRRDDDGSTIGVVSDTYTPVLNEELYDIAEAIEGESKGTVQFETGGSLKGGAKVWLMLRLREPLRIAGDSETMTIPYFALQNSHDGSGSLRGQATMTRIVCDNTAKMADLDAKSRGTEFRFSHTATISTRIEQAKDALAGWKNNLEEYNRMMNHLSSERVYDFQVHQFMEKFIPMPNAVANPSERVITNVERSRAQWLETHNSVTGDGIRGTRYGLLQTSIEYLQHVRRANTEESRFRRAYLDTNVLVQDATRIAQAV